MERILRKINEFRATITQRTSSDRVIRVSIEPQGRRVEMALEKAKEFVSSNPVAIFSKSYCPFCVSVKKLLSDLGATFKAVELDTESDGGEIQAALAQWTGQRTVPNVFIGGKHIGGCDDTTALQNQGKLVPMLIEVGALAPTKVTA